MNYYCSCCGHPQNDSFSSQCCGAFATDEDGKNMILNTLEK